MKKQKITLWDAFKKIINEYFVSGTKSITRQEIIVMLRIYKFQERKYNSKLEKGFTYYSLNTLDNFRNMCEKLGYLSKNYYYKDGQQKVKLGVYNLERPIEPNLTITQLRENYNKHW